MRVMVLVKATDDSEKGVLPTAEMLEAMGRYNEELVEAGIMRLADETRRERVKARRAQVKTTLTRLIWTEGERGERGERLVDLERLLEQESLHDGFLDDPVEAVIARLREDLGLPANDAAATSSDPSPDRRSSA